MYAAPKSALLFFVACTVCWFLYWRSFPYPLAVHILSALHGATLVADHFSGRRPADEAGIRSRAS